MSRYIDFLILRKHQIFMQRWLLWMAVFVSASFMAASDSQASVKEKIQFKVEKFTLSNGLTVLVHEDHSMPLLSYQQWFRVGSSYERPGRTGLAHFFEHLMFKGTTKYPKGTIEKVIQMNGGSNNAFTTEDMTGYYTNLPSDKLELIIDIESDRMRNLIFDPKEIDSEREVVKEERRMRFENSVYGSLYELVRETRYKTSPYRWPVIGSMADLNATKLDELKAFYEAYYAPNNTVVVVAGAVKTEKVKELVQKYYGPIKAQTLPEFKPTAEATQYSQRSAQLTRDVQSTTYAIVYPTIPTGHADESALDLVANALGAGSSSRLYKRLVYKNQLATSVSVSHDSKKLSGELSIYVALAPGADFERSLALVNTELAQIKRTLMSDRELQKLKNMVMLSYVKGLQTIAARAHSLASNEIFFSDYRRLFESFDKYEKVTAADIQRVANTYIAPAKRSLIQLRPKDQSGSVQ
jgi:zinc protease